MQAILRIVLSVIVRAVLDAAAEHLKKQRQPKDQQPPADTGK